MSYVELHARSAFSFLRGASLPEALATEAARQQLPALALCDRGGVYGAVRLHLATRDAGMRGLVGCELPMEDGTVVPVLVASQAGYRRLSGLLTTANLRAPKGEGRIAWTELADNAGLIALTGDEDGPVRRAWREHGASAAAAAADRLRDLFGPDRLYAELQRHLVPGEEASNRFLVDWAAARHLPLLATNGVLHADRAARPVADVFTCLREHTTIDRAGRRLAANAERHVKGDAAMRALFADLPEAVEETARLAARLEFTLADLGYRFPDYHVPVDESQDSFLRKMTYFGAQQRYGSVVGDVRRQIEKELTLITRLGFSGYFLIVWDICAFARERGILVQGRGSAANSVVCYALGITAVDPIESKLLFERFLSEGRTDWPDIDLDLPSESRREEVIQEMYRRHGRRGAAMTANVISFRGRSTMREVGKVLGLPDDVLDRFSSLYHGGDFPQTIEQADQLRAAGVAPDHPRLGALLDTCSRVHGLPRHLGQHSGGMVLSAGNLDQFVPLENARMPGRSVLQWDKSDCEDMGLVKIDLLGLGMMAVLQDSLEICAERGQPVDLARIPKDDPATFKLIQEADTIGVFQIESRAQMSTLPRMKPETFYDLAIEVAIIRPGPIQGDAVNPYLERRAGRQPVTYPDERARAALERTLGVVLFQEQVLRLAMELGGFSAAEADELRRAIGFTRTPDRLDRMKVKLGEGMRRNGVSDVAADYIQNSLASFALYGFPESHAISFALIAYASCWLKVHRPAAFYASLLNCQPMGFYSPATLVQDGRRRGIHFLPACVTASAARCRVDRDDAIRLGLRSIHGLRDRGIASIVSARTQKPFVSVDDFLRRTDLTAAEKRVLSGSGALNALAGHRRAALWQVEAVREDDDLFRHAPTEETKQAVPLERMTLLERVRADYDHLSLTVGAHPMKLVRDRLPGLKAAGDLSQVEDGSRVTVGGAVITRQRPGTAKGVCFITLEDETGLANAIVRPKLFEECRLVINLEPALVITGRLQNKFGVIHILAETITGLPDLGLPSGESHNYH
ncbi:MAG TPA: error-prone DNA polymerase [Candidatus Didemnitutus sp.]|nr:error-prone DNA polymerase [Candidatus Didemnitutus sp.]